MAHFTPLYGMMITEQPLPGSEKREIKETLKRNRGIRKSYEKVAVLGPSVNGPDNSPSVQPEVSTPSQENNNDMNMGGPKMPGM